jgi:nucleoside-diphosphate-sugar epimerase
MLNVIVTGGSGFIGLNLVKSLANAGLGGVILDVVPPSDTDVVSLLSAGRWKYQYCDLSDNSKFDFEVPEGEVHLIHLASKVHNSNVITANFGNEIKTQIGGFFRLVEYLMGRLAGISFASTIEVYGRPERIPVCEAHPTNPHSLYGALKLSLEKCLIIFCEKNHVPYTILRVSHVYGPGKSHSLAIPTFIEKCLKNQPITIMNDGADLRDFVHVDDVSQAFRQSVSIMETLEMIQEICETKPELVSASPEKPSFDYVFDISKAKRKLAYEPTITLSAGLRSQIEWAKRKRSSL